MCKHVHESVNMGILDSECIQRFKLGFLMGGFVGASMGVLLGTYSVLR